MIGMCGYFGYKGGWGYVWLCVDFKLDKFVIF